MTLSTLLALHSNAVEDEARQDRTCLIPVLDSLREVVHSFICGLFVHG
jgi:hypothetical protein